MGLILLIFSLLAAPLFGDPKDSYFLAVTEGEPSSLVEGMASAITGDLYLAGREEIEGAYPLPYPCYYLSGNGKGNLSGWGFIEHLEAEARTFPGYRTDEEAEEERHFKLSGKLHYIRVVLPSGSRALYLADSDRVMKRFKKKKGVHFYPPEIKKRKGATNTFGGSLSAQNLVKNSFLTLDPKGMGFTVTFAGGAELRYEVAPGQKVKKLFTETNSMEEVCYRLHSEKLPSGAFIFYRYDKKGRVEEIRIGGKSKTFAKASITHLHSDPKHPPDYDLKTSDGRLFRYRFDKVKDRERTFRLKEVLAPEKEEQFSYFEEQDGSGPLLSSVKLKGGFTRDIDYYRLGKNTLRGESVTLKKGDYRELSVKRLWAPLGERGSRVATHEFVYGLGGDDTPVTQVYDVEGARTVYYHDDHKRLIRIYRKDRESKTINYEDFQWSKWGGLLARTFYDGKERAVMRREFSYDEAGNVLEERFIDAGVVATTKRAYSQDGRHLLIQEEAENGKITRYAYHPQGGLVTAKFVCKGKNILQRSFYTYDDALILVREITDDGTSENPEDVRGVHKRRVTRYTPLTDGPYVGKPREVSEYFWDGGREVLLKRRALTYAFHGQVAREEVFGSDDKLAYVLLTDYDEAGRVVRKTNELGQAAEYRYDEAGNLIFAKEAGSSLSTYNTYDLAGRLIEVKEVGEKREERVTRYAYDLKSRRIASWDPTKAVTRYVYDAYGRCLETHLPETEAGAAVIRCSYDGAGRKISETDPLGLTTLTSYNARSQVTQILHPDGTQESFTYSPSGELLSQRDRAGHETSFTYDILGRILTKKTPLGTEEFCYDAFHLLRHKDCEEVMTTYAYDGAGRVVEERVEEEVTKTAYDSLGRPSRVTKGELTEITTYDELSRVVCVQKVSGDGVVLKENRIFYDAMGNIATKSEGEISEYFTYDSFKRLTSHTDGEGGRAEIFYLDSERKVVTRDPLGLETIEIFDARKNILSLEKRNRETLSFEALSYDLAGRLTAHEETVYPGMRKILTTYEYDASHRCIKTVRSGRLTTRSYTPVGKLASLAKPSGLTLFYTYDSGGNLLSLKSSDGSLEYEYHYNREGKLVSAIDCRARSSTDYQLDPRGRVLQEKLGNGLTLTYTYDARGRRESCRLPHGGLISYAYDALYLRGLGYRGLLHSYSTYDLGGRLLEGEGVSYELDGAGRLRSVEAPGFSERILERDPVGNILTLETRGKVRHFSYDPLYQLTEEQGRAYAYDSHHNRLEDEPNELGEIAPFEYDLDGNPIRGLGATYTYDALDRLIRTEKEGEATTYTYDALDRRLSKTTREGTQLFLYDGKNEIGSYSLQGEPLELRILGETILAESSAAVFLELGGSLFKPVHDLFGNVVQLTELATLKVQTTAYSAFGIYEKSGEPFQSPWLYFSKREDPETGFFAFGRRYYLPTLGRFLTQDPKAEKESANLYAFVENRPLTHFDPYGLEIAFPMPNYLPRPIPPFEEFHLGRVEFRGVRYEFGNGIYHTRKEAEAAALLASKYTGGYNVHVLYNRSVFLNFVRPLAFMINPTITPDYSEQLAESWKEHLEAKASNIIVRESHSENVLLTRRALQLLPENLRRRIFVVAVGPADFIPKQLCGGVVHLCSKWDPVALVARVKARIHGESDTFQILSPHPQAKGLIDHTSLSPTYAKPVSDFMERFTTQGRKEFPWEE